MRGGEKKSLILYGECGSSLEKIHAWKLAESAQAL